MGSSIPPMTGPREFRALVVFVLVTGLLSVVVVRGLLAPLIVGAWFAGLTGPLVARISARLGDRGRVAAVATVVLVLTIVVPLVLLAVPLARMITSVANTLLTSPPRGALEQIMRAAGIERDGTQGGTAGLLAMARSVGPSATALVSATFSTVSTAFVQVFILMISAYYFSAEGPVLMASLRRGSPFAPSHLQRLEREFMDVARAMLVGELLTAAVQGLVAGIAYALLGVDHALFFAVLTGVVALLPTIGSALVWVPLCIALALGGQVRKAVILAVCGVFIIGTVDNILRPYFAKLGAQKMHPLLLFLGIFGGIEAFGGWGIILGPLVLALFVAAYRIYAAEAEARRSTDLSEPTSSGNEAPLVANREQSDRDE